MKRRDEEATRVFDKQRQIRVIQDARRMFVRDYKSSIAKDLERKSQLGEVARQNIALAQNKIDQLMHIKDLDRKEEADYLENGLKLLDLNQQRFKDKVRMLDMKNNGRILDKLL